MVEPKEVRSGRVRVYGCSPGCLLVSIALSVFLTLAMNGCLHLLYTPASRPFTVVNAMLKGMLPDVEVQRRSSEAGSEPYIRSYVFMRRVVGWLAVVLPPLLVFGEPLVFDDRPFPLGSLSAYYYSGFREVFVGFLCAIGVFLVIYKWPERTRESWVSSFAGLAVVVVAFFPTGKPGDKVATTPLQDLMSEAWVERIHFAAAFVFIFLLSRISHYWSKHRPERRRLHQACEWVILAALVLAALEGLTDWPDYGILIAEFAAVWAFGVSWLATVERLARPAPP